MEKMYYLIKSEMDPNDADHITTEIILKSKKVCTLKSYLRGIYEEALEQEVFLINGTDMICGDELPPKFKRSLSICHDSFGGGGAYEDYVIVSAADLKKVKEI